MRISIKLNHSQKTVFLPYNYPEYIQAAIYGLLPPDRAAELHETGFVYEKRRFKLFTFSRIQGKLGERNRKAGLSFISPISIQFASPVDWILQDIAEAMLKRGELILGGHHLQVNNIQVHAIRKFSDEVKIKMISPMTVYSTLAKADGKKLTHYYTPFEREFSELAGENLCKKYRLLYNKQKKGIVSITPLFEGNRERIIKFKGTVIKAWDGKYLVNGDPDLIHVAHDTGFGSKNSQGFGMWEIIDYDIS